MLKKPNQLVSGFSVAAICITALLLGNGVRQVSQDRLRVLEEQLQVEATLLTRNIEYAVETADLLLTDVVREAAASGPGLTYSAEDWGSELGAESRTLILHRIRVIDALGREHSPSGEVSVAAGVDIPTAPVRDGRLEIGRAHVDPKTGRRLLSLSRKIFAPDGKFLGLAVVDLDVELIERLNKDLPADIPRTIAIFGGNGGVFARQPAPSLATHFTFDEFAKGFVRFGENTYLGRSLLDGRKMLGTYREARSYPVTVVVGADYEKFLDNNTPTMVRNGLTMLVVGLIIVGAARWLHGSLQEAEKTRQRQFDLLRDQYRSERLARTVVHQLPYGRVAVIDEQLRYVYTAGQGFRDHERLAADKVLGRTLEQVHTPDTAQKLTRMVRAAFAGDRSRENISGEGMVFEVVTVPLKDESGQVDQVCILSQDVTNYVQNQHKLEELNQQLREISYTDSLMGIANRRAFDETSAREWQRSMRQRHDLALLLVDVDHFKLFNDTYGHGAGDQCLQRLAEVLKSAVNRPADLVARYGGEEMAILLPDTDLKGAETVAKRLHARLAKAALPFPDSPTAQVLTVSIGVAAARPSPESSIASLLKRADAALYKAKEQGRNRTAIPGESGTVTH